MFWGVNNVKDRDKTVGIKMEVQVEVQSKVFVNRKDGCVGCFLWRFGKSSSSNLPPQA
jgi:hypothetical protein